MEDILEELNKRKTSNEKDEKIEQIKKGLIAAKLSTKSLPISDDKGNDIELKNCFINSNYIRGLDEYLQDRGELTNDIDLDKIGNRFVVIVTLPDGRDVDILVQNSLTDVQMEMAIIKEKGENGEDIERPIILDEDVKESIGKFTGITKELQDKVMEDVAPKSFLEYAQKVSNDELIVDPKNIAEAIGMELSGKERSSTEHSDEKELNKEDATITQDETEKSDEKKKGSKKKAITEEISQECSEILSQDEELKKFVMENGGRLKQVLKVKDGESIRDMVQSSGSIDDISFKKSPITIFRFSDGQPLNDRIVMIQDGRIIDDRRFDEDITEHMRRKEALEVDRLKDNETKLFYTDMDGNTTVVDFVRQPNDLSADEKRQITQRLDEIESMCLEIKNNLTISPEEKLKCICTLNQERLDILSQYGLCFPEIEEEMRADMEEMQKQIDEKAAEENEDDDHDPRESRHNIDRGMV